MLWLPLTSTGTLPHNRSPIVGAGHNRVVAGMARNARDGALVKALEALEGWRFFTAFHEVPHQHSTALAAANHLGVGVREAAL